MSASTLERPPAGSPGEPPADGPTPQSRKSRYASRYRTHVITIIIGIAAIVIASVVSVLVGTAGADIGDLFGAIWSKATGTAPADPASLKAQTVIWELRLPRVGLAILGGIALAVAGVLFQGLLRNPLVSPFTLGIAPAAAFGASLAIVVFGAGATASGILLVVGALVAGIANTVIVLLLASRRKLEATTLILLGIALTQLFGALTAAIQYFADDEVLAAIVRWTWGSVNNSVWYQVVTLLVLLLVALPWVQLRSGTLNAIAFGGDDAAKSLGVPVTRVRFELIAVATVLTAVAVSFMGIIGFVGLVGPHIARLLIGGNHRFLLPFAAVIGALLLIVADIVGRQIVNPAVMPVGIIDAIVGAPIFIYLILSRKKALS